MKKSFFKILAMAVMLAAPVFPAAVAKEPVKAAAEDTSKKQTVKKYYVTSDDINVRSGPGTDYSVLGSLTRGMEVKVISIQGKKGNRWARIKFQGLTAYVSAKHLAKAEENADSVARDTFAKQTVKKYYVTSDVLNVRSGPGMEYPTIGSLTCGMEVKVTDVIGEKRNRWAEIRFEGFTAYVSAKNLAKK